MKTKGKPFPMPSYYVDYNEVVPGGDFGSETMVRGTAMTGKVTVSIGGPDDSVVASLVLPADVAHAMAAAVIRAAEHCKESR